MEKIDFNLEASMFGGTLDDIPKPHVYKWPGCDRKRTVTVRIVRYPGFPHYHISIGQEDNPIWSSKPKDYGEHNPTGWTAPWRDYPGKGITDNNLWDEMSELNDHKFPFVFTIRIKAVDAIEKLCAKIFPDHDIVWEDFTGELEKLYIGSGKYGG